VIQGVVKRSDQTQQRECFEARGKEDERTAEPQKNDADIFDTVVGKQSLQVMLGKGIQNPKSEEIDPAMRISRPTTAEAAGSISSISLPACRSRS